MRKSLRFSPTAWSKLLFVRDLGPTEIGGFGITDLDDPLLVLDFVMPRQSCTPVSVDFDESAIADYVDEQVDQGRSPAESLRIWVHTHPGECPRPSMTDEKTFDRVFGETDWSVMFILAQGGATYGRLQCRVGPHVRQRLRPKLDFSQEFDGSDHDAWAAEYDANLEVIDPFANHRPGMLLGRGGFDDIECCAASEWVAS
ncbi:hypothetical protein [Roseiconus lacunae]|uniref:hypothetical protein n=1 Tax=Roseiconus lacunae TaxID=2605694 RepID=UPI001E5D96EE|nr:hypothetical protein [Roseiconus lacunae]MCD0458635.1 hypothetical protein [Roseiconus lacunae]